MSNPRRNEQIDDDECDELMDWVSNVYAEQDNQPPTIDLTQYEVVLTPNGVYPTDSTQRVDL